MKIAVHCLVPLVTLFVLLVPAFAADKEPTDLASGVISWSSENTYQSSELPNSCDEKFLMLNEYFSSPASPGPSCYDQCLAAFPTCIYRSPEEPGCGEDATPAVCMNLYNVCFNSCVLGVGPWLPC